jgi:hypothetical protein
VSKKKRRKKPAHTPLAEYLRWVANDLGLRDWTVTLSGEWADDPDAMAYCECTYGRKLLTVKLGQKWGQYRPEDHRHAIVHECLHAHFDPIRLVLRNLQTNLGDHVYGVAECSLKDAIEWAVDGIAGEIAKHFPLPPARDGKGTT